MGSVNFWYVKFHRLHILSTCIGKSNNPVYLRRELFQTQVLLQTYKKTDDALKG